MACRGSPWLHPVSSTHPPADDRRFDWAAGIDTVPCAGRPSAQEWNDIGADVILAKKLKRLVRRWNTFVSEGVDSYLPGHHARLFIPAVYGFDVHIWRCNGIATRLYNADKCLINQ
jgi:hypothetical protein